MMLKNKTFYLGLLLSVMSVHQLNTMEPPPISKSNEVSKSDELKIRSYLKTINEELGKLRVYLVETLRLFRDLDRFHGTANDIIPALNATLNKTTGFTNEDFTNLKIFRGILSSGKTAGKEPIWHSRGYTSMLSGNWGEYTPKELVIIDSIIDHIDLIFQIRPARNVTQKFEKALALEETTPSTPPEKVSSAESPEENSGMKGLQSTYESLFRLYSNAMIKHDMSPPKQPDITSWTAEKLQEEIRDLENKLGDMVAPVKSIPRPTGPAGMPIGAPPGPGMARGGPPPPPSAKKQSPEQKKVEDIAKSIRANAKSYDLPSYPPQIIKDINAAFSAAQEANKTMEEQVQDLVDVFVNAAAKDAKPKELKAQQRNLIASEFMVGLKFPPLTGVGKDIQSKLIAFDPLLDRMIVYKISKAAEEAGSDVKVQEKMALEAAPSPTNPSLKDAINFAFLPPLDPTSEGFMLQMEMEAQVPLKKVLAYNAGKTLNELPPTATNKEKISAIKILIVRDKNLSPSDGKSLNNIVAAKFREPLPELATQLTTLTGDAKIVETILLEETIDPEVANEAGVLFQQAIDEGKTIAQARTRSLSRLSERTGKSEGAVSAIVGKLMEALKKPA